MGYIYGRHPHQPVHPSNMDVQIKRGDLKNVIGQKWQPVVTNYGCPKQLLIVQKHQYNFSCSLHLYIKQNNTFLITNFSNVRTKSYLRNQTRLCIHLLVFFVVPFHSHVVFGVPCFLLQPTFLRVTFYVKMGLKLITD